MSFQVPCTEGTTRLLGLKEWLFKEDDIEGSGERQGASSATVCRAHVRTAFFNASAGQQHILQCQPSVLQ
jgi:hypothetical protein